MLTAKIEVTGTTQDDVELAVEEALKRIRGGNIVGFDSNDDGSFSFEISGEEEGLGYDPGGRTKPVPDQAQIRQWIDEYVNVLNKQWQEQCARDYPNAPILAAERYESRDTVKYAKIVKARPDGGAGVFAFIELATGDVYKPDGAKRPAKGVRYRLADDDSRARLLASAAMPEHSLRAR